MRTSSRPRCSVHSPSGDRRFSRSQRFLSFSINGQHSLTSLRQVWIWSLVTYGIYSSGPFRYSVFLAYYCQGHACRWFCAKRFFFLMHVRPASSAGTRSQAVYHILFRSRTFWHVDSQGWDLNHWPLFYDWPLYQLSNSHPCLSLCPVSVVFYRSSWSLCGWQLYHWPQNFWGNLTAWPTTWSGFSTLKGELQGKKSEPWWQRWRM